MSLPDVSGIVNTRASSVMTRILRYDVAWGKPFGVRDYRTTVLGLNPAGYWKLETGTQSDNLGFTKLTEPTASYMESYSAGTGVADTCDACLTLLDTGTASFSHADCGAIELDSTLAALDEFDLTVEAWIKLDDSTNGDTQAIISTRENQLPSPRSGYLFGVDATGHLFLSRADTVEGTVTATSTAILESNTWYHVVGVWKWGTGVAEVKLYINGELDSTTETPVGPRVHSWETTIGCQVHETVSITHEHKFLGSIDEVAVYHYALPSGYIAEHYRIGSSTVYPEYDEDLESDNLYVDNNEQAYVDVVTESAPLHWWRLGEAATTKNDSGSSPANGTTTTTTTTTGAVANDGDLATVFHRDTNVMTTGSDLDFATAGANHSASIAFWFKRASSSDEVDHVLGFTACPSNQAGWFFWTQNDGGPSMAFERFYGGSQDSLRCYQAIPDDGNWYHIAVTVSETGKAKIYRNGVLVNHTTFSNFKGLRAALAGQTFQIATQVAGTSYGNPGMYLDELMMWARELTAAEINLIYLKAKYGTNVGSSVIRSSPDDDGNPFETTCQELATLENEEDISDYVLDFVAESDLQFTVDSAVLDVSEDWGADQIRQKLRTHTYVKIQQRYQGLELGEYDTDWVDIGHYLVSGPGGVEVNADGHQVYKIPMQTPTRMLSFDVRHKYIEPDLLHVPKTVLENTVTTTDRVKFKCPRVEDPTKYYENWAISPAPRIWLTNFQTYNANNPQDIEGPNEIIRLRGAEGSAQVLGGAGEIVFNRNFYESAISDNGLGNPNPSTGVMCEFWRYATTEDLDTTTIASIGWENDWYVGLTSYTARADNKTMYVLSGNAKGKMFRLYTNDEGSAIGTFTTAGVSASGTLTWASPSNALSQDTSYASVAPGTLGATSEYLVITGFDNSQIPTDATIKSIRFKVRRYGQRAAGWDANQASLVKDYRVYIVKGGVIQTGVNKAISTYWTNAFSDAIYGGDLWSLSWTQADLGTGFGIAIAVQIDSTTDTAYVDRVIAEVEYSVDGKIYVRDIHGYPVSPENEGLQVGDTVQVGNCNRVEDIIHYLLMKSHFQNRDSTKPFYFEIEPSPVETTLPPLPYDLVDNPAYYQEVMDEVRRYAPPNYYIYTDNAGVTRVRSVVQSDTADHVLDAVADLSEDRTDYGVYTRVVAVGQGGDSIDVGLHTSAGGTSAVRAYKLDDYLLASGQSGTKSQADANAIVAQVLDGNPKTPSLYTTQLAYGVIFQRYGPAIRRWEFEDTDLMVIDLGKNTTLNRSFEIEAVEFSWMNMYAIGKTINQSMYVYAMTEEDYIAEFGISPPDVPDQDDADLATSVYMPPADARSWKLLVDEVAMQEGQVVVEAKDFTTQKPIRARYLKLTVGQNHWRYEIPGVDSNRYARISLNNFRAYTSTRIVAVAELGLTPPYNTGEFKKLSTRLRRRTQILDKNVYLDTFAKSKNFAINELGERYREFVPTAINTWYPSVMKGDTVEYYDPSTNRTIYGVVGAVTRSMDGRVKATVVDYSTGV